MHLGFGVAGFTAPLGNTMSCSSHSPPLSQRAIKRRLVSSSSSIDLRSAPRWPTLSAYHSFGYRNVHGILQLRVFRFSPGTLRQEGLQILTRSSRKAGNLNAEHLGSAIKRSRGRRTACRQSKAFTGSANGLRLSNLYKSVSIVVGRPDCTASFASNSFAELSTTGWLGESGSPSGQNVST